MASKYWFANHPSGRVLAGSLAHDFGNVTDGNEEAVNITVRDIRKGIAKDSYGYENEVVLFLRKNKRDR